MCRTTTWTMVLSVSFWRTRVSPAGGMMLAVSHTLAAAARDRPIVNKTIYIYRLNKFPNMSELIHRHTGAPLHMVPPTRAEQRAARGRRRSYLYLRAHLNRRCQALRYSRIQRRLLHRLAQRIETGLESVSAATLPLLRPHDTIHPCTKHLAPN